MSTVAMYYFQGDLGESMEYPNAFVIPNTSKPTFGTFLKHFPTHEKDISNKDEILPFYQESIMAKVLRTDEAMSLKRKTVLRRKNMEALSSNIVNGGAATFSRGADGPPSAPTRPERPTSTSSASKNAYERTVYSDDTSTSAKSSSTSAKPASIPKPPRPQPQKDFESDEPSQPSTKHVSAASSAKIPAPSATAPVSDILDFDDSPAPSPTLTAASAGMGSAKVSSGNLDAMMDLDSSTPTPNRAELKASKEVKINDQVKKALEEKLEMDRKADQEQNDFDSARAQHDQKLLAWSSNNKERRNIRSLLSTMHTVLWSGSRWKTIGLGDLLEPRQVKLQYRKAMLVVHPDHNVNLSNEHKYIAKRVFEAVNEAYNEFTTKENV